MSQTIPSVLDLAKMPSNNHLSSIAKYIRYSPGQILFPNFGLFLQLLRFDGNKFAAKVKPVKTLISTNYETEEGRVEELSSHHHGERSVASTIER